MKRASSILVALLAAACGDAGGGGPDFASLCRGCIQGGLCQSGRAPSACGEGGVECVECGATQTCVDGACKDKPACNRETCLLGCCDENGTCQSGIKDSQCGGLGNFCEVCTPTQTCKAGLCEERCGPSNCLGCCASDGTCLYKPMQSQTQCGAVGKACAPCQADEICGAGFVYDDANQDYVAVGSCQPAGCEACAPGCCAAFVVGGGVTCDAGTSAMNCGRDGALCGTCLGDESCKGQRCIPGDGAVLKLYLATIEVPSEDAGGSDYDYLSNPDVIVRVHLATDPERLSGWITGTPNATVSAFTNGVTMTATVAEWKKGVTFEVADDDTPDGDDPIGTTDPFVPTDDQLLGGYIVVQKGPIKVKFQLLR